MFVVLALRGSIGADNVMIIISMVVSFYFGTQHEKIGAAPVAVNQETGETVALSATQALPATVPVDAATYNATHPDDVQ